MFVFGAQSDPKDLRFSGFREQSLMKVPARGLPIPDLGRSGRHFQLCYNLKGVTLKKRSNEFTRLNEWSIRQAAIYHQFDVVFGTTLWIVTKGRLDIQQRYKELTGPDGRPEDKSFGTLDEYFRSTLAAHLLYCHWSTEDWRWYIRWLEDVIDEEVSTITESSPRPLIEFAEPIVEFYGCLRPSRARVRPPRVQAVPYPGSAVLARQK